MNPAKIDEELQKELADPAMSLRLFGRIQDIDTGGLIPYGPARITRTLQQTVLSYCSDTPRNREGQTLWLLALKFRQAGVSTQVANCGYTQAAYKPEQDVITIADSKDRAQYLHSRVHALHRAWPEEIRSATIPNREARQMTFANGSKIRTLSGDAQGVGIGLTPSFLHMSELPWWPDLGGVLGYLLPALLGVPLVPGWITPAIPVVLLYLQNFEPGPEAVKAMFALQVEVFIIFLFLGLTGLGNKLITVIPNSLKSGIIIGAGIAAMMGELKTGGRIDATPISLLIGSSYGAGHYGMCGRAFDPRFLFAWPSAKSAVMGGAQLAGVLTIVNRAASEARGQQVDEVADAALRAAVEAQIEAESLPMFLSGRLYDDGVIDPRDTRTVLGMCLSAIASGPIQGASNFGVFRM